MILYYISDLQSFADACHSFKDNSESCIYATPDYGIYNELKCRHKNITMVEDDIVFPIVTAQEVCMMYNNILSRIGIKNSWSYELYTHIEGGGVQTRICENLMFREKYKTYLSSLVNVTEVIIFKSYKYKRECDVLETILKESKIPVHVLTSEKGVRLVMTLGGGLSRIIHKTHCVCLSLKSWIKCFAQNVIRGNDYRNGQYDFGDWFNVDNIKHFNWNISKLKATSNRVNAIILCIDDEMCERFKDNGILSLNLYKQRVNIAAFLSEFFIYYITKRKIYKELRKSFFKNESTNAYFDRIILDCFYDHLTEDCCRYVQFDLISSRYLKQNHFKMINCLPYNNYSTSLYVHSRDNNTLFMRCVDINGIYELTDVEKTRHNSMEIGLFIGYGADSKKTEKYVRSIYSLPSQLSFECIGLGTSLKFFDKEYDRKRICYPRQKKGKLTVLFAPSVIYTGFGSVTKHHYFLEKIIKHYPDNKEIDFVVKFHANENQDFENRIKNIYGEKVLIMDRRLSITEALDISDFVLTSVGTVNTEAVSRFRPVVTVEEDRMVYYSNDWRNVFLRFTEWDEAIEYVDGVISEPSKIEMLLEKEIENLKLKETTEQISTDEEFAKIVFQHIS